MRCVGRPTASADAALDTLAEHRIAWQFLTGEDIELLAGLPAKAEAILTMLESRKASA